MDETDHNNIYVDITHVTQEMRIRPEVYTKILKSFAYGLNDKIKKMNELINKNDLPSAKEILHEIRGTASNLRLNSIQEEINIIQAVLSDNTTIEQSDLFAGLRQEIGHLIKFVQGL